MSDTATLSLEITRHFEAAPERVFDAWLSKTWCEWLPPRGVQCELSLLDAKVGGRYHTVMRMPDGRTVNIAGVYREIDRPKKIVLTWTGDYDNRESLITVTFWATANGTQMTLRQEGFASIDQRDRHNSGWTGENGSFDKLAALLAKTA